MPVSILKIILVSLIQLMSTPKAFNVICLQLRNKDFLFLTAGSTENMMYIPSTKLLTYIALQGALCKFLPSNKYTLCHLHRGFQIIEGNIFKCISGFIVHFHTFARLDKI